jgi:hypothetical protein
MEQKAGQAAGTSTYSPTQIKASVDADIERLLAPWMVGRPLNYTIDTSTMYTVAVGYWLAEELTRIGCNDADRKTQCWKFNLLSRTYDIFETASECMIEAIEGRVEQNRKPHRRWG